MKTILHFLILTAITLHAFADPLGEFLFPPELLERAREEVPLTDGQHQNIQLQAERMSERFKELQERIQKEADALAALVRPERVETPAALAQFDRLLDAERDMKRAQVGFMLAIKNQLTPEQQARLLAFRKAQEHDRDALEEVRKRIIAKAERVRVGIEKLSESGGDTAPIAKLIEEARALMKQDKPKDAEAAIDRALKALGDTKPQ